MARKPLDQDLYDSVVAEAKRKFAVWPSAYASGWVVKTYKERGGRYAGAGRKERTGLTKWFGENWVDLSRPTADGGYEPCGRKRSDDPADYPKCRPEREAMRMSKEEVADAVRRKRRAEASAPARGSRARAPTRVATYRENPDTDAFRRWFGDSKVVDAAGEPLVVYHGAPDVRGIFAGGFKRSSMRGDVFFATDDPRTAETYTDPHRAWDYQNAEPGVIPLYLRIENPLVVDAGFQHWRGTEHVIEQARQAGHDGVVIENTIDHYASDRKAKPRREDACTVFAFFSPTQVKSALTGPMKARDPNRWHVSTAQPLDFTGPNDGTFDLADADLRSNPAADAAERAAWQAEREQQEKIEQAQEWLEPEENPLMLDAVDDPLEPSFKRAVSDAGRLALVYHGTSTAAFWPVVTSGLSFDESRKAWEGTSPGVFVAFDQNATDMYASRAVQKVGGRPICFVLEVPYEWLDIDIDDYLTHDKTRKAQAMVHKTIPPSKIVGVMFAEGMGWGPEIPIKRAIAGAKKGKYVDDGINPPMSGARFRTGAATRIDVEHAALNYLVDLLQYTSLADVLLQPEWGAFQRRVLQALIAMPSTTWLAWTGRDWLAFSEGIIGEKNEEPYTEQVLQEPRFKTAIGRVLSKYGNDALDRDRILGPR